MNRAKTLRRAAAASVLATVMAAAGAQAADLELVKPGSLIVAYNGDMPGTGVKDGKLIGLDGEVMQAVGESLGLKVEPQLMEWAAEIESVKGRRVDAMHGMMGWNEPRTKVINITDPIYYGGAVIAQKEGSNFSTVKALEGKTIGSIQGFGWINDLKAIPGATLQLYDTSDAAIRDLLAGRIEALFADPPLIQYAVSKNPDWKIHVVPLKQDFDPKFPVLTAKYNIVFGLSKDAPELLKAVNAKIADIWASCKNVEIGKKYGLGDPSWYEPGSVNQRAGKDRPADWKPPVLPEKCKG